jgi:hypothetical protein
MFLCGGPRNAENNGAQKNLNVAILAPLYHAPGMGHTGLIQEASSSGKTYV